MLMQILILQAKIVKEETATFSEENQTTSTFTNSTLRNKTAENTDK